ncbi:MAG TPA: ferritin-like domain-containing protein [Opitutaceae bacterium]|nr:ferritin-like domain-containing protein [Opitutaceae bacterium]
MKNNVGIGGASRCEIGRIINLILADEFVLYTATRGLHWSSAGRDIESLHDLLEEQFGQVAERIELLVERSCSIGVWPRGGLVDLAKAARLDSDPSADLPTKAMVAELHGLHGDLAVQLRSDIGVCAERCPVPLILDDLFGLMRFHEEAAARLREVLAMAAGAVQAG